MQLNAETSTRKFSYVFKKKKLVKVRESLIYLLLRKSQDYHAMPCEM